MDLNIGIADETSVAQYIQQVFCVEEVEKEKLQTLLTTRKLPLDGWHDELVERFINSLSSMDSNNFSDKCGLGEREARFASNLVARRHYRMGHGVGRSGDITELQPKAAGSTLLNKLANDLVLDLLQNLGTPSVKKCFIVPMATGMSLMFCLRYLHSLRPKGKYVIWPRIDQKSCFKCILTAGLIPIIINCKNVEGQLVTDMEKIKMAIEGRDPEAIVCVLSTMSCFAPRAPDNIEGIGTICEENDIPHLINNAYGIQCKAYMERIEVASKNRVDMFVSSTDKNFMVPVGGSIIAGFDEDVIKRVSKMYPGRGSGTPSMDVLITLLSIGKRGYLKLLEERNSMFKCLLHQMKIIAYTFHEDIINVPLNKISIGFTLNNTTEDVPFPLATEIGAMLFTKLVSGTRVVPVDGKSTNISGFPFKNWGSHTDNYPIPYLTAAASIGITDKEVLIFAKRFVEILVKCQKYAIQVAVLPHNGDDDDD